MATIRLSAASWKTPQDAHRALAVALDFPAYYGHNLDALHDCLTALPPTELLIANCGRAAAAMPEKWPGFVQVFLDSARENSRLRLSLYPGSTDWDEIAGT